MYQTLLFDLDGTLTDSKEGIINCVIYALDYYGITNRSDSFLNQFIGPPLTQSFQQFCGFDEEKAKEAAAKYRERFSTIGLFENRPYEGAVDMLRELKQAGKTIALATSKPEVFMKKIIARYGLAPYIDHPVGATLDDSRSKKSDVILEALRQCGITTEEQKKNCLMIGDRFHDIRGAKETNLDSLGCAWGYAKEGELKEAGATYICETIKEATNFLLSH